MTGVYFLHRIKHTKAGTWDKGIEIKYQKDAAGNLEDAQQAFHAYLGAYAYGHDANTDYVCCCITDSDGNICLSEAPWSAGE